MDELEVYWNDLHTGLNCFTMKELRQQATFVGTGREYNLKKKKNPKPVAACV